MAVSVSPIKIISDLGYDPWEIESDEDYLRALKEATNEISIANPSDGRISMLMEEVRRVRADRKAADPKFKARKTKINVGSFLGRDTEPQKLLGPSKDQKKKAASGGLVDTINSIAEAVGRIENTLIEQKKLDEVKIKNDKQFSENLDRDNEESRLGKVTGFLKKAGDKIIAPVQGIFSQIFGFIKKLILGKIFLNIIKWFGNPANQGKIDGVIKFFSNNWKKLLSLYLVFGTGIGKFVRFITKVAIKGVLKLGVLLAKIAAAKGVKGARGIAKLLGGKKGAMIATGVTAVTSLAMYGGVNKMLGGGEKEEPQKFNKGGKVRGQGDKDTVPAMLTPGEFVMSKGAVQQYGVDTMEAMNAAAGGTNVPVLMPDKKRRGYKDGAMVVPEGASAYTGKDKEDQEAYMLHWVNKEREFQGLPPLKKLTYAQGVYLTKQYGPGPRTNEQTNTFQDFDKGFASHSKTKTVDGKTSFEYSMSQLTAEDRKKYLDENPKVKEWVELQNQLKLDALGMDISETSKKSAGYKGGGLVSNSIFNSISNFNGGGLVLGYKGGGLILKNNYVNLKHPDIDLMAPQFGLSKEQFTNVLENSHRDQLRRARKKAELFASKGQEAPEKGPGYSKEQTNEMNEQWTKNRDDYEMGYEDYWNYPTVNNKKKKSGGGFGLKRMIGGAADQLTGNLFDFDKRSGGGLIRKTANAVGKAAGGTADMLTGNLFDFDNKSGGGLIRKTANALGSLFGGSKTSADKVMAPDKVMAKEPKIKEIKIPAEGLDSLLIKIASKQDIKTPVGQPSLSGPKITVLPENKSINTPMGEGAPDSGKAIPKFDVGYGSVRKMKQLGISR